MANLTCMINVMRVRLDMRIKTDFYRIRVYSQLMKYIIKIYKKIFAMQET